MVAFPSPTLRALMAGVEAWGSCSPLSAVTEPFLFPPLLLFPPLRLTLSRSSLLSLFMWRSSIAHLPLLIPLLPFSLTLNPGSLSSSPQTPLFFSLGTSIATLMTPLSLGLPAFFLLPLLLAFNSGLQQAPTRMATT
ncbi:hypothetical protein FKM82_022459 [Ascaphus truei]